MINPNLVPEAPRPSILAARAAKSRFTPALALVIALVAAPGAPPAVAADPAPGSAAPAGTGLTSAPEWTTIEADTLRWRAERERRLKAENGWLSLVGLHWLAPGANSVGSAADANIRLDAPGVPPRLAVLHLKDGAVELETLAAGALTISGQPATRRIVQTDRSGRADVLRVGRVEMQLIERGGKIGVRVRDPESPTRVGFRGIEHFPLDPAHRVEARFIPFESPRQLEIGTILGTKETVVVKGRLEFELGGRQLSLLPFDEDGSLFLVFRDQTSGIETYGAARFLSAPAPKDGRVVLDFNRAYNPPCAFTPYATCPLPPPENRLPLRIAAGEKKYDAH